MLCTARVPVGQPLCAGCAAALPRITIACPRCAAPLAETSTAACGACQQHRLHFDATQALFHYQPPVDRLIQNLKYHRQLSLARVLGNLLAEHLDTNTAPDMLVPVPLHPARLRERGYNQSLELARVVARRFGLPLATHAVRRVRATPPQTTLTSSERRRNVRNVFHTTADFSGKRVAIVDDVMTSGHTVNALAKCLRRAGAINIVVWVVARA
ncbi:MAG: ComF family protein [Gammaproteobacteria bacterium]|nr:ComF family protein [Gammaproteobacteria bacterium]